MYMYVAAGRLCRAAERPACGAPCGRVFARTRRAPERRRRRQAVLEQLRTAEDKTGPLELLLVIVRALGAGKFESLYGIFGGGGAPGARPRRRSAAPAAPVA